jgi:spoIIIJ-associated protein
VDQHEFYGSSVDQAREKAAKSLGVGLHEVEYQVIDEGSAGFLGIGARDARIRVSRASSAPPVEEALDKGEITNEEPLAVAAEAVDEEKIPPQNAAGNNVVPVAHGGNPSREEQDPVSEETLLEVDRFLTSLVSAMGLDAVVDVYDTSDSVVADISTPQTGLFIGQKGETIDSVQHLVNVFASKQQEHIKRVVVDSEGYRQRRVEAIQGMAHRSARRSVREGRAISLPPMTPSERRVVHIYLAENDSVETSSEGAEGDRHVVISPSR